MFAMQDNWQRTRHDEKMTVEFSSRITETGRKLSSLQSSQECSQFYYIREGREVNKLSNTKETYVIMKEDHAKEAIQAHAI